MGNSKKIVLCIWVVLLFGIHSYGQTVTDLRPTVTMKEYVDAQVDLLEEMNKLRDEHQREISRIKDENIKSAYTAVDKRLEGMNEFRQSLNDSNKTYITRTELIAWASAIIFAFGFIFKTFIRPDGGNGGKNIVSGDKVEVKK